MLLLSISFCLTACGEVSFSPSKSSTLNSVKGFEDDGDANGEINQPGGRGGDLTRWIDQLGGRNGDSEGRLNQPAVPGTMDIERVCSNSQSSKSGSVFSATKVVAKIVNKDDAEVCAGNTKDYRADLINMQNFTFTPACALSDGEYEVTFFDDSRLSSNGLGDFEIIVKNGAISYKDTKLEIVYSNNPKNGATLGAHHELCDDYASPLVVKLGAKAIRLSAPLDGILFNILGSASNSPVRQISWTSGDDSFAFISLPDASGTVSGIDQLFGDNTKGPDGKFSVNGYDALAKYDSNGDARIDSKDAVYSALRLWIDRDRDGRSSAGELETLAARGITAIDLVYDAGYQERDRYGNKILYKSIAERENGEPLLVFDIWFRLIM